MRQPSNQQNWQPILCELEFSSVCCMPVFRYVTGCLVYCCSRVHAIRKSISGVALNLIYFSHKAWGMINLSSSNELVGSLYAEWTYVCHTFQPGNIYFYHANLLQVTSEYHFISFHYMILRDYIHLRVSSEYFSFGAHIMKLVSLL